MDWTFDIKYKHIDSIKRFCKDRDGKPLDLLAILDSGNFEVFVNDVELVVNVVFVLCYAQVREHFNLADYEKSMQSEYEMFPELKEETEMFKAARWFGGLMNGPALEALSNALMEAFLNFYPNESRRSALKKMSEKSKELEKAQSEEVMNQIDEAVAQAKGKIQAETKKRLQESLSGVFSGSMPE